jgi:hypothetical protein
VVDEAVDCPVTARAARNEAAALRITLLEFIQYGRHIAICGLPLSVASKCQMS